MQGYASPQPTDRYGNTVDPEQAGAVPALTSANSGALLSSIIALDGRATVVEVVTGNGAAAIKWWGSVIGNNPNPSMTTVLYDNAIPANGIRRFVIPQSIIGQSTGSVIGGYGSMNGLYTQMTVIPLGAGASATSIFTAQFA